MADFFSRWRLNALIEVRIEPDRLHVDCQQSNAGPGSSQTWSSTAATRAKLAQHRLLGSLRATHLSGIAGTKRNLRRQSDIVDSKIPWGMRLIVPDLGRSVSGPRKDILAAWLIMLRRLPISEQCRIAGSQLAMHERQHQTDNANMTHTGDNLCEEDRRRRWSLARWLCPST